MRNKILKPQNKKEISQIKYHNTKQQKTGVLNFTSQQYSQIKE